MPCTASCTNGTPTTTRSSPTTKDGRVKTIVYSDRLLTIAAIHEKKMNHTGSERQPSTFARTSGTCSHTASR